MTWLLLVVSGIINEAGVALRVQSAFNLWSVRALIAYPLAVLAGFLPKRYWDEIDLPILTGLDAAWRRLVTSKKDRTTRHERLALEKADEPDRVYDSEWAGLAGVDYVVVAARRKPGMDQGRVGDHRRRLVHARRALRSADAERSSHRLPLTLQTTTLDVLRKGVSYELPPLRKGSGRMASHPRRSAGGQTQHNRQES